MPVLVTGNSITVPKDYVFGVLDSLSVAHPQSMDTLLVSIKGHLSGYVEAWSTLRGAIIKHYAVLDVQSMLMEHYIDYAVVFSNGGKTACLPILRGESILAYLYGKDKGTSFSYDTKPMVVGM